MPHSTISAVSPEPRRVRALFISDVHLGTKGAQVEALLEFLKYYDAETIYLVGDIVDGWRLKQVWHGRRHTMTSPRSFCEGAQGREDHLRSRQ